MGIKKSFASSVQKFFSQTKNDVIVIISNHAATTVQALFIVVVATMLVYFMWAFAPNPPVQKLINRVVEVDSDGPLTICDIAIGTTTTAQYQDRVDMQKKTLLKRMCNNKSNYRFITDDGYSTDINAIYSACPTDYHSVCCKTADLVHRLCELFPTKRWFMKCDDDSYVVPECIVEFLSNLNFSEPIPTGC
jgi:hypothetical protein